MQTGFAHGIAWGTGAILAALLILTYGWMGVLAVVVILTLIYM